MPGDELTLEDVRQALKEAHDRNIKHTPLDRAKLESHLSADGYYEFDSWEEYRKVFGGLVSVEEAFGAGPKDD